MHRALIGRSRLFLLILFLTGCSSGIQRNIPVAEDVKTLVVGVQSATFQVKASADDAEGSTSVAAIQYLIAPSSNSA